MQSKDDMINIEETLYNSKSSYNRFAKIQEKIINSTKQVHLNFNIEGRVGLTFILCISILPLVAEKYKKDIVITCNNKILDLLHKIGYIDDKLADNTVNIVPLLKSNTSLIKEPVDVLNLVFKITKEAPVKMSEELEEIFASKIGEMFNNSIEHSESDYIIGAKYFKNAKNLYCFSCYDLGVGIPKKVVKANEEIKDQIEAFKWAMKKGNTTVKSDIPRGLGLELLKGFAKANNGTIRMCSNNVFYQFKKGKDSFNTLEYPFEGTLFEMDIIADNNHKYIIK